MRNHYRVLNIPRNAKPATIKEAYRAAALESHPDKGGQTQHFQEVKEAYAVLSDTEAREEYEAAYIEEAERRGYVVCPDCFAKNRVGRFAGDKIVKCGLCKLTLDLQPDERNARIRSAIAEQTSELVEVLGSEGSALAKDAIRSAANWTRRKLGIGRG